MPRWEVFHQHDFEALARGENCSLEVTISQEWLRIGVEVHGARHGKVGISRNRLTPFNDCYWRVATAEASATVDAPIPPGRDLLRTKSEVGSDKRGDGLRCPEVQYRKWA